MGTFALTEMATSCILPIQISVARAAPNLATHMQGHSSILEVADETGEGTMEVGMILPCRNVEA